MTPPYFPFRRLVEGRPANAFLPIRVTNPETGKNADVYGLIDTGAGECCVPDWLAAQLGHDLKNGIHPATAQTASGKTKAWAHTMVLDVIGTRGAILLHVPAFPVRVFPGLPFVLLGVSRFLELRRLTVDYPKQVVTLA